MENLKKVVKYLLLSIGVLFLFSSLGCSKDDESDAYITTIQNRMIVDVNVTLPLSSPSQSEELQVLMFGEETEIDTEGSCKVSIYVDRASDMLLFLPPRDGEIDPTLFLATTILPGNNGVKVNSEETALWLLYMGIDQNYLHDHDIALYVKSVVKENSQSYIDSFKIMIEADPYLLRMENSSQVFTPLYLEAVRASNAVLNATFVGTTIPSTASMKSTSLSGTAEENLVSIQPSVSQNGFSLTPDNNGDMTLLNASRVPSIYRMTDTTTQEVLREIPTTTAAIAFSPDILGPISGPFNVPLPDWTTVSNNSRNVKVEIYTPGIGINNITTMTLDGYTEANSPSGALLARAAYSSVVLPTLNIFLPIDGKAVSAVFSVIVRAGFFDALLPYWKEGNIAGGLSEAIKTLDTNILIQIVDATIQNNIKKMVLGLGYKIIGWEFNAAAAGISYENLKAGLYATPSKLTYFVENPISVSRVRPVAVLKVADNEELPVFTLDGHGFKAFTFDSIFYEPRLSLLAFDKDNAAVTERVLTLGTDVTATTFTTSADGTAISFSMPRDMVGTDTRISNVELTFHHTYLNLSLKDTFTDVDTHPLAISLPTTDERQKEFTLHVATDIMISHVDEDVLELGDPVILYGHGFAGPDATLDNTVYFEGNQSITTEATVTSVFNDTLFTTVPNTLILDYSSIGKAWVFVKLEDNSTSNKFPLSILPERVSAVPEGDPDIKKAVHKGDLIVLRQSQNISIYYTINNSSERLYRDPIEIDDSTQINGKSTIVVYAKKEIDGVVYTSESTTLNYWTCLDGATFIDYPHGAQCVILPNEDAYPNRYCPLDKEVYADLYNNDRISTGIATYATCTYTWMIPSEPLTREMHWLKTYEEDEAGEMVPVTIETSAVNFWTEPEGGRPLQIWQIGSEKRIDWNNYIEVCPNGLRMIRDATNPNVIVNCGDETLVQTLPLPWLM